MVTFKKYYELVTEIQDSTRNQQELIRVYGLDLSRDGSKMTGTDAILRAKDLIKQWNDVEASIDPKNDYFGAPNSKTYNPRDIFSWGRIAKDMGWDHPEGLENLKAMITNLYRHKERKVATKESDKDYDVLVNNEHATLYRPKSENASCKLGARTKWCTAATEGPNQFNSYMAQGIVLFYVITKRKQFNPAQAVWPPQPATGGREPGADFSPPDKYAIALYPDGETLQVFDAEDKNIDWDDWEDIAYRLGLPTEQEFYMKFGPKLIDVVKFRSNTAKAIISGQQQRDENDPEGDEELLADVLAAVRNIFKAKDPVQVSEFTKYREQENMPDEVFLMNVYDISSLHYFTDIEYNPPGSHNWANGDFQDEMVRHVNRLTTVTKQANSTDWKHEDVEDMDDLTYKVSGPSDGDDRRNMFHQIQMYISRHMKNKWPAMEKALINLWMTNHGATEIKVAGGYSEHTDHPFDSTLSWLYAVMNYKNGEWPELEKALHTRIKHVLHKDPGNDNLINGLISMGLSFNRSSNNHRGHSATEQIAYVPESSEHLKRYADGEWDIDGPPLTQRAESEQRWKKGYNKSENV